MSEENKKEKTKEEKLQDHLKAMSKEFGKESICYGNTIISVPVLCSTGSLRLDLAIGIGGIPKGRIIEITGAESSGKTTLTLHLMAECQKNGLVPAFVDAEHSLDPVWATNIGVNMQKVLLSQPSCGEEALDIVERHVESGAVDLIIVDSVSALVPRAELEGDMGDQHMGLQARLMSQALRKLTPKVANSGCVVIFINQIRHKMQSYKIRGQSVPVETTSGGNALKFYASVRLDTRRAETDKEDDTTGSKYIRVKVTIKKNKVAPPFKVALIDIETGVTGHYGFNLIKELVDLGSDYGYITKAGSWYSYGDEIMGQGKDNASQWLINNPEIMKDIKDKIIEKVKAQNSSAIGSFDAVTQESINYEQKQLESPIDPDEHSNTVTEEGINIKKEQKKRRVVTDKNDEKKTLKD